MRQFHYSHGLLHIDLAVVLQQTFLRIVVIFAGDAVVVFEVDGPAGIVGEIESFGVRAPCVSRLGLETQSWLS